MRSKREGRTLPMLWLLLAATVAFPITALCVGGYFIWQGVAAGAERDLHRRGEIVAENASRVFETHDLILREIDLLTRNMSDAEIREHEAELHQRMAELIRDVPQIRDVSVWGTDGIALVIGKRYPVPALDSSERDYFKALAAGAPEPFVSTVLTSRIDQARIFTVARRRSFASPGFHGAITVSIDPRYFERRWIDTGLASPSEGTAVALVRADGSLLARAPDIGSSVTMVSASFLTAIKQGAREGRFNDVSVVDGMQRHVYFRQLARAPLYISNSVSEAALRSAFVGAVTPHLWFGIPSAILLIWLVLQVIRRSVEAEVAVARANAERAARAEAEKVLAHTAKLESIGRLAAGLAHDFNNILAAAIGGIELSLRRMRDGRTGEVEPLLEQALQAARRGADLTRKILAFARGVDEPGEAIDAATVIAEIVALLPPLLGPAVRLQTDVASGLWPVRAGRPALESALINLAVNARDAMPEGGVITIRARNIPPGPTVPEGLRTDLQWVRIAVSDNGPGFPEAVKARAFEPFVTTKEVGRGTGLGLSQVYGGAREAGGTARIEDQGDGATVALYLPRGDTPVMLASAPANGAPPSRSLRVLLVDDDRLVQATSALSLRDAGHTVLEAESGEVALAKLRDDRAVDVLVVDYAMPGMNGRDLAYAARRMRPELRVLMVSGQANLPAIDLPPGVARLSKPFVPDDLVRAVDAMMADALTI